MINSTSQFPARLRLARCLSWLLPPLVGPRISKRIYPQQQAYRDDLEYTLPSRTGSLFVGSTSDFHGYNVCVSGFNDWRNVAIARALCSRGDTIIEVGANVGTETIAFRDIVGAEGKVCAFEPLPSNLEKIRKVSLINHWSNVVIYPLALDRQAGVAQFATPPDKHASGVGHLAPADSKPSVETIQITCAVLDEIHREVGAARLICSDTEGAETRVFQGARAYLKRYKPAVVVEASPKLLERCGSSIHELAATFSGLDYSIFAIERFRVSPWSGACPEKPCNWLCLHGSHRELAGKCSRMIFLSAVLPCVRGLNPLCLAN